MYKICAASLPGKLKTVGNHFRRGFPIRSGFPLSSIPLVDIFPLISTIPGIYLFFPWYADQHNTRGNPLLFCLKFVSIFKEKIIYFSTIVLNLSCWGDQGEYIKTAIKNFRLQSFLCNHAIIEKIFSNLLLDVLDYNKITLTRKGVKNNGLYR